jgi:hypothetical protein
MIYKRENLNKFLSWRDNCFKSPKMAYKWLLRLACLSCLLRTNNASKMAPSAQINILWSAISCVMYISWDCRITFVYTKATYCSIALFLAVEMLWSCLFITNFALLAGLHFSLHFLPIKHCFLVPPAKNILCLHIAHILNITCCILKVYIGTKTPVSILSKQLRWRCVTWQSHQRRWLCACCRNQIDSLKFKQMIEAVVITCCDCANGLSLFSYYVFILLLLHYVWIAHVEDDYVLGDVAVHI